MPIKSRTVKENHGGVFLHYKENRCMTPRELAELQSFPKNFIFKGSKSKILKQIGNAVPPKLGEAIGKGRSLKEITSEMNMVAEGIYTAKSVHQLRLKHNVEMPIHEAIYKVLFEDKEPRTSVMELMKRKLSEENN